MIKYPALDKPVVISCKYGTLLFLKAGEDGYEYDLIALLVCESAFNDSRIGNTQDELTH